MNRPQTGWFDQTKYPRMRPLTPVELRDSKEVTLKVLVVKDKRFKANLKLKEETTKLRTCDTIRPHGFQPSQAYTPPRTSASGIHITPAQSTISARPPMLQRLSRAVHRRRFSDADCRVGSPPKHHPSVWLKKSKQTWCVVKSTYLEPKHTLDILQ